MAAGAVRARLLAITAGMLAGAVVVSLLGDAGLLLCALAVVAGAILVAYPLSPTTTTGPAPELAAHEQPPSSELPPLESAAELLELPLLVLDSGGAICHLSATALHLLGLLEAPAHLEDWPQDRPLSRTDGPSETAPQQWLWKAVRGEWSGAAVVELRRPEIPEPRTFTALVTPVLPAPSPAASPESPGRVLVLLTDETEHERTRSRLQEHEARRLLRDAIAADVNAGMAIDQIVEQAVSRLHVEFPHLRVAYAAVDERARMQFLHSQAPPGMDEIAGAELELTQIPDYFEALMTREALVVEDVKRAHFLDGFAEALDCCRRHALVDVPLRHSETLRGVLCFDAAEPRAFSDHEVTSLRTAADCLAVALGDAHRQEERLRAREQMRHDARHDRLTGLPNRAHLFARLQQVIRRRLQHPEQRFALLFLDLDHFQVVNEGLGHDAGDQLLLSLAERLRSFASECSRSGGGPPPLPARLGGDEFVLLVEAVRDPHEVERIAEQLQACLAEAHLVGDSEVSATASIGIVIDDGTYTSPEQLLRDADSALYGAKRAGKARHVVFDDHMHSAAIARLRLERDLRHAVERGEFVAHYQPIVDLRNLHLVGFESLMRWEHPETGLVPPNEFIPLAEELGLIEPMGEWILRESARQLVRWEASLGVRNLVMHVNVSRRQLSGDGIIRSVESVLAETGIHPSGLKLEVTETTVMAAPRELSPILRQLRERGVRLCMDDFGTGQSSLAALMSFPIDVLKVDRSFVGNIEGRPQYAAITEAIVTLAHSLGMEVVAEGVEKRGDLDFIRELQCDQAQGFLFSRPLPAAAAETYIQQALANGGRVVTPEDD